MTGVVHVLGAMAPLPHGQEFYDDRATEKKAIAIAVLAGRD